MSLKSDIEVLCKEIAEDYPGWKYIAGQFKNDNLKHTHRVFDLMWTFRAGEAKLQTRTMLCNKNIISLSNNIFGQKPNFTSVVYHSRYVEGYVRPSAIYSLDDGSAEKKIRYEMDICMQILKEHYPYDESIDEITLLKKLPEKSMGLEGIEYCLVRAYLDDFGYVSDYCFNVNGKGNRRNRHLKRIDQIIEYYDLKQMKTSL